MRKHFDEGRQAAQQLTNGSRPAAMASDPVQHLLERTLRFQEEVLPLVLDSLRALVKTSLVPASGSPPLTGSSTRDGLNTHSVVVELISRRPVEVSLELRDHSESLSLATPGLHSLEPGKRAIANVSSRRPQRTRVEFGSVLLSQMINRRAPIAV
jgi:hypothetical protein